VDNETNNNDNKHSFRSNTKGYGSKTYWTDSRNNDTTATSGRKLYHLQFSLQAAYPETFGYMLICAEIQWKQEEKISKTLTQKKNAYCCKKKRRRTQ
jgi:hypothetical protein